MFRILVVDDDPAGAFLLRELMKNLRSQPEVFFVQDGLEALDFLHCRGAYANARPPDLILLDINMPRLGGLETLSAIKNDPELYVIPVVMMSVSALPEDVRESYLARANGYVQKPTDLEGSIKLIQAVETFWVDFALLPTCEQRTSRTRKPSRGDSPPFTALHDEFKLGTQIAKAPSEARSRAMQDGSPDEKTRTPRRSSGCEEHNLLLDDFGAAVRGLLDLHEQQFLAIVDADSECTRFDLLIHMANEKKQRAKYAYLRHVEAHGCSNENDLK